jgi:hypothetical protein
MTGWHCRDRNGGWRYDCWVYPSIEALASAWARITEQVEFPPDYDGARDKPC